MDLVRLVYASEVDATFSDSDIEDILSKAQTNNPRLEVTGMLLFTSEYFVQCIEGPRKAINQLYNKILLDPRHHSSEILTYSDVEEREFANWSMGYVSATKANREVWLDYLPYSEFKPLEMRGPESVKVLLGLRDEVLLAEPAV